MINIRKNLYDLNIELKYMIKISLYIWSQKKLFILYIFL